MGSIADQIGQPMEALLDDIRQKFQQIKQHMQEQEPLWDMIQGFVHAVNWQEHWIIGLILAHAALLVLTLLTRRNTTMQTTIAVFAVAVVYFGERLNWVARKHWQAFSSQNYFDKQGVFFSVMVSAPLLLVMFIILVNYLLTCTSLLVQAKRAELKHKAKQKRLAAQAAGEHSEAKKDQ